eukprot:scaffold2149_cov187-Cylindrotheca_fusiformis.AAC.27
MCIILSDSKARLQHTRPSGLEYVIACFIVAKGIVLLWNLNVRMAQGPARIVFALAWILMSTCVKASVIFPLHQIAYDVNSSKRKRLAHGSSLNQKGKMERHCRQLRRAPSVSSCSFHAGDSGYAMIETLKGLGPESGVLLIIGAGVVHVVKKLRSESLKRALDFWVHAGPIVLHYKFTRWFLATTNAPLKSESRRSPPTKL